MGQNAGVATKIADKPVTGATDPMEPRVPASVELQVEPTPEELPGRQLLVAAAQMAPRLGDVRHNFEHHLELIAGARKRGVDLLVFPELSLTGYFLKDLVPDVALRVDSPTLLQIARASEKMNAVFGCVLESDDHRFFNAAVHVADGRIVNVHRKVYLPTYGLFDEARYLAQGEHFRAFTLSIAPHAPWKAGLLICEDMWHPSSAYLLARQSVDVMLCISASPGRGVGKGHALGSALSYEAMCKTYSQLGTSYLIYCNRVGYEDGINFWGGSMVWDPLGKMDGEPAGRKEELLIRRIDLNLVRRARIANPLLRDERYDVVDRESERIRRVSQD